MVNPEVAKKRILLYENPDSRCHYPFEPSSLGYCWGYAKAVDEDRAADYVRDTCPKSCEFWEEVLDAEADK